MHDDATKPEEGHLWTINVKREEDKLHDVFSKIELDSRNCELLCEPAMVTGGIVYKTLQMYSCQLSRKKNDGIIISWKTVR